MIITSFPTGLFESILPSDINNHGSVVFTISNQIPPRTQTLNFSGVTSAALSQANFGPLNSFGERRASYGVLISSTSKQVNTDTSTGSNMYYAGQVLEFGDDLVSISGQTVNVIEINHISRAIDINAIGIDQAQLTTISTTAASTYNTLIQQISDLRSSLASSSALLVTKQKTLSESKKVSNALQIVYDIDPSIAVSDLIADQITLQTTLSADMTVISATIASLNVQIAAKQNQITGITPIVE